MVDMQPSPTSAAALARFKIRLKHGPKLRRAALAEYVMRQAVAAGLVVPPRKKPR